MQRGSRHSPQGSGDSSDVSLTDHSLPLAVSEDELRTELSLLGFPAVSRHKLLQFKEELEHLMRAASDTDSAPPSSWPVGSDSYGRHSVSAGGQEVKRAPGILTRKVLRRTGSGQVEVCDESSLSSEEGSLSVTEESEDGGSTTSSRQWRPSSADGVRSFIRVPPYSLLEQYRQQSDPVSRYHDYKQSWDAEHRGLERRKKELRWGVRERMMSAPPAPPPRTLPPPNTYIIPTEKKRYDLRWAIRQDLVHGNVPRGNNPHGNNP